MLALAMLALIATGCTCPATGGTSGGSTTTPSAGDPSGQNPPAPQPGPEEPAPAAPSPKQGEECPAGICAQGLECVEYYGIAGTSGPKFTSCEIRCKGGACPDGQQCATIADGPGQVCRPK